MHTIREDLPISVEPCRSISLHDPNQT